MGRKIMRLKNFFKSDAGESNRLDLKKYLNALGLKSEEDYEEDNEGDIYCRRPQSDAILHLSSFWAGEGESREAHFIINVPAIHIPKNNCLAFYRRLLEFSFKAPTIPISANGDILFIRISRPLQGLDKDELLWLMVQAAEMANFLRTDIAREFNAPLFDFDKE
jgi:hypothetical protein